MRLASRSPFWSVERTDVLLFFWLEVYLRCQRISAVKSCGTVLLLQLGAAAWLVHYF